MRPSAANQNGQAVLLHGTLATAVVVNGRTLVPKGADVSGAGGAGGALWTAEPSWGAAPCAAHSSFGGRTYDVAAETVVIKGESHTKSNLTKIGGGTAAGTVIGAIAGGGKGAAIGAGVGAAAGTGVAAAMGKKPAEVVSEAVLMWVAAAPPAGEVVQGEERRQSGNRPYDDDDRHSHWARSYDDDADDDCDTQGRVGFSQRERRIISDCFVESRSDLPPGLAKRDRLPPGLERQLQRNGTLPPGLQKRVQPLPGVCTARLPRLPQEWVRVVLGGSHLA